MSSQPARKFPTPAHLEGVDPFDYLKSRGLGALADRIGMEFLEFSVERSVARLPVLGNTQPTNVMHGGAFVVLGESLGSMSANLWAGPDRVALGIEINASHSGSAASGWVTGVCVPLHLGRSLTTHMIEITDENGRLCSSVRITNFIRPLKPSDGNFKN